MAIPTTTNQAYHKKEEKTEVYWNVWDDEQKVNDVIPALGEPQNVFGGQVPEWFPSRITNVLDAGCGPGVFVDFFVNQDIEYVGVDGSELMIKAAMEKYPDIEFKVGSLMDIPYKARMFDLVWANAVLIHNPTYQALDVLTELKRVTKKFICFNMYIAENDYLLQLDDDWGILNVWGKETEENLLSKCFGMDKVSIVEETDVMVGYEECITRRYLIRR